MYNYVYNYMFIYCGYGVAVWLRIRDKFWLARMWSFFWVGEVWDGMLMLGVDRQPCQYCVITDKSGARHGPMSRARDLARNAAKKQAGSMKEEQQKSRKAQIIKDASKGKDKFEKDPIITDTTVKTDNLQ